MSDFLMRMVMRAAGASPAVVPRLPHPAAYSAIAQDAPPPHSMQFEPAELVNHDAYLPSDFSPGRSSPFEGDDVERAGLETSATRRPHDSRARQILPLFGDETGARVETFINETGSNVPGTSEAKERESGSRSIQPIRVQSRTNIARETVHSVLSAERETPPDFRSNWLQSRHGEQDMAESAVSHTNSKDVSGHVTGEVLERGKANRPTVNEPKAALPGRNAPDPIARRRPPQPAPEPVEVKIGRVEVIVENPAPPLAARPSAARGFEDYAALRRYSPQAWNRMTRQR